MYYKYLKSVLRHKWFVFIEACRLGVPWFGFIHDASKFQPCEFFPYAKYFHGDFVYESWTDVPMYVKQHHPGTVSLKADVNLAFDVAWHHHQKHNKHHWQAWLYVRRDSLVAASDIGTQRCSHIIEEVTLPGERPERITPGPIHIGRTKILVNGSDGARCLHCGKTFPLDIFSALPMPERYISEMVADWRGAGRAYGNPNTVEWYEKNKHNQIMHSETRRRVEELLNDL